MTLQIQTRSPNAEAITAALDGLADLTLSDDEELVYSAAKAILDYHSLDDVPQIVVIDEVVDVSEDEDGDPYADLSDGVISGLV